MLFGEEEEKEKKAKKSDFAKKSQYNIKVFLYCTLIIILYIFIF